MEFESFRHYGYTTSPKTHSYKITSGINQTGRSAQFWLSLISQSVSVHCRRWCSDVMIFLQLFGYQFQACIPVLVEQLVQQALQLSWPGLAHAVLSSCSKWYPHAKIFFCLANAVIQGRRRVLLEVLLQLRRLVCAQLPPGQPRLPLYRNSPTPEPSRTRSFVHIQLIRNIFYRVACYPQRERSCSTKWRFRHVVNPKLSSWKVTPISWESCWQSHGTSVTMLRGLLLKQDSGHHGVSLRYISFNARDRHPFHPMNTLHTCFPWIFFLGSQLVPSTVSKPSFMSFFFGTASLHSSSVPWACSTWPEKKNVGRLFYSFQIF